MAERSKALPFLSWTGGVWVRIPLETYIFILNFSLPPRSEQVNGAVANEIKHVHSPEVIVVLDPRYDLSYKALYISTCSIALNMLCDRSCLIWRLLFIRLTTIDDTRQEDRSLSPLQNVCYLEISVRKDSNNNSECLEYVVQNFF